MSRRLVALLVVLGALAGATPAWAALESICSRADVFFCENFEDRTADQGTSTSLSVNIGPKTPAWAMSGTNNFLSVATGVSFDGTKAMKFSYPACSWKDNQTDNWAGCAIGYGLVAVGQTHFFMRHYAFWSPGYLWSPIADKHLAMLNSVGRAPWAWHAFNGSRSPGHYYEPTATDYPQNTNLPATLWSSGHWFCVEGEFQAGTGNGIFRFWIDGVLKLDRTNVNTGTTGQWNDMMISGYWNTIGGTQQPGDQIKQAECLALGGFTWNGTECARGPQTRYLDNLVMATQAIGCLGAAPPPVLPGTPINVQVTQLIRQKVGAALARVWTWFAPVAAFAREAR